MNIFQRFVSGLGAQNMPYGLAPNDPQASYRAGLQYMGDLGSRLMANNQGGVSGGEILGASMTQAKDMSRQRAKEDMAAKVLFDQAEENRRKREEEAQRQKWMDEQISQLPADQQGLARMMPDKFFGNQIDSMFSSPDLTSDMKEYNWAVQGGFQGTPMDFLAAKKSGNTVNVTMPGEIPDANLRKKLDEQEGQLLKDYKAAGAVSGSNAADFEILGELVKIAPQGPIQGRLAAALPGVSSAGDAFQSIVKRIAPTLRAPGSGATSDIEYDGMLRSLPALANKPEANNMILSIMKAKADLNVQRADIITQYQVGDISASDMRREIAQLDRMSILTPEMKAALSGISGGQGTSGKGDLTSPSGMSDDELNNWLHSPAGGR